MGEDGAVAPDNPSSDEQGRLEAAGSLLERNGELVFKLNGAMGAPALPKCLKGLQCSLQARCRP